jgi:hypothetical protein
MGFSPVLCPAVGAESLSRQKRRFAALRAETNKRLKPVLPLVGVYRTGKRFRLGWQLQAHRHNDFLEIRATFTAANKAGQTLFSKTMHRKVASERDPKTRTVRLIIGAMLFSGMQGRHVWPPA